MGKKYFKGDWDFENDPSFYEELVLLEAQETIASLMAENNVSKTKLAERLGKPKSYVKEILSEGRGLTLKNFGRICFFLGAKLSFASYPIEEPANSWQFPENLPRSHMKTRGSWKAPSSISRELEEELDNSSQEIKNSRGYCFQKATPTINDIEQAA